MCRAAVLMLETEMEPQISQMNADVEALPHFAAVTRTVGDLSAPICVICGWHLRI
jgi:hypothetical protein